MGYGSPPGLIAVPPPPTPSLQPVLNIHELRPGTKVNVAGEVRTVDDVVYRGPDRGYLVRWRERNWTEAPGPYNTAGFLEAVGAYREEAA